MPKKKIQKTKNKNSKKTNSKQKTNYYDLFIMGFIFMVVGLPLLFQSGNWGLFGIGFVFMIAGASKKKEWIVDGKNWTKLKKEEKRKHIIALRIFLVLFAIGLILYFIFWAWF